MLRHGLPTLVHRVPAAAVVVVEVFLLLHGCCGLRGLCAVRLTTALKLLRSLLWWVLYVSGAGVCGSALAV